MKKTTIKNYLKNIIPDNLLDKVNRSFEIIGDIAITEITPETIDYQKEIGEAIIKVNSSIKTVLKKSGIHKGEFRTQDLIYIAGENKKETIYTENSIKLKINPETVYFSARLSVERAELMEKLEPNKKVLVMFSGIGPYTFVALKKQPNLSRITSIELNPEGYKFTIENQKLNKNLLKKSNLYKDIIKYLRENNLPVFEKKIIENLNQLKINQINSDVKKQVELFKLKEIKEIKKFNFNKFLENNQNKNLQKNIFNFFKTSEEKEITIDINNLTQTQKEILKFNFLLFQDKFNFKAKIKNKFYLFDSLETKSYLLNYLEEKDIENIVKYEEIYMPLPKDAELFLENAFKISDKNCIIHMYDFLTEEEFPNKSENIIKKYAEISNKQIQILQTRKVGQYAPGKYRVCCDFIVK